MGFIAKVLGVACDAGVAKDAGPVRLLGVAKLVVKELGLAREPPDIALEAAGEVADSFPPPEFLLLLPVTTSISMSTIFLEPLVLSAALVLSGCAVPPVVSMVSVVSEDSGVTAVSVVSTDSVVSEAFVDSTASVVSCGSSGSDSPALSPGVPGSDSLSMGSSGSDSSSLS